MNNYQKYFYGLIGVTIYLTGFSGCLRQVHHQRDRAGSGSPILFLAQAQFKKELGEDGQSPSIPGPAKLTLVKKVHDGWETEILEDQESNVFHKALWFKPPGGEPGILTIGGNEAVLKLWHKVGQEWQAKTFWNPTFGGAQNRLRDLEVGDVTGDGIKEIVIATHDQGVVAVLTWENEAWKVIEVDRSPETFVHEIEIGDVNNDGIEEFFATPSAPNRLDGTPQPGKIIMYRFDGGAFVRSLVEEFPSRHVKEILTAKVSSSGHPDLFAVIEGEISIVQGEMSLVDTVKIKQYQWNEGGWSGRVIADLPDMLCRYLTSGDVDKDGKIDLVASTLKSGIWLLRSTDEGNWEKILIDEESSGFEHATLIADLDSDGDQEIYVASDDQHFLRCYQWDGHKFCRQNIISLNPDDISFGLTFGQDDFK